MDLPIGLQPEFSFVVVVLRLVAAAWAVALLLFGRVIPRAVVGTFLLAVGLGLGWVAVAGLSLLLATVAGWSVFAAGMGVYLRWPRIVMALALCWPLPALYLAHLFFTGSFERSGGLLIALALAGAIVGAVFPRRAVVVLAASLGTALLFASWPFEASFVTAVAILVFFLIWQIVVLGSWLGRRHDVSDGVVVAEPPTVRAWLAGVGWVIAVPAGGLFLAGMTAPMYSAADVGEAGRLTRLEENGSLVRPGLVVSAASNYYLSGRAFPVAVVVENASLPSRLAFPLVGRSLVREVRTLRAVKDEDELALMRRAAAITSKAFGDIQPRIQTGVSEAEIEAAIVRSFAENGATGVAFKSVVGSGANAVLPHYQRNDATMTEGLVVIDIGCSVDNYASDMTRTFSVSGEYTAAERELIETVIRAGDAARRTLAPGVTLKQVDRAASDVIGEAGFERFFTHGVGHHVGLSVHDPGRSPLEKGMVITIEPGIYVPAGADVDPAFWNLGVRIEDTYIVTEDGWEEITDFPRRPYPE